jgi:hypothetical protein
MIQGKVVTYRTPAGDKFHKVCVVMRDELTGSGGKEVPMRPIDAFAAHLPDPDRGHSRRLVYARTNRAGTVLMALVRDERVAA